VFTWRLVSGHLEVAFTHRPQATGLVPLQDSFVLLARLLARPLLIVLPILHLPSCSRRPPSFRLCGLMQRRSWSILREGSWRGKHTSRTTDHTDHGPHYSTASRARLRSVLRSVLQVCCQPK